MSCNLTKGRSLTCKNNIAGVKEIYITRYEQYNRINAVFEKGVELISIPNKLFYKFELGGLNANFNESLQVDDNGNYFNVSLSLPLVKLDTQTARELNTMVNSVFHIVVKLNNGKYYFLGFENGLELSSLEINSGSSYQDFQGYNLTFQGKEQYKGMLILDIDNSGIIPVIDPVFVFGGNNQNEVIAYNNNAIEVNI